MSEKVINFYLVTDDDKAAFTLAQKIKRAQHGDIIKLTPDEWSAFQSGRLITGQRKVDGEK